jgi:hypothetical protein
LARPWPAREGPRVLRAGLCILRSLLPASHPDSPITSTAPMRLVS